MGASIYWEPRSKAPRTFDVGARSKFVELMQRKFGASPWELSSEHIPWLEGVRDAGGCGGEDEIIDAIHKHERIRVWPEY